MTEEFRALSRPAATLSRAEDFVEATFGIKGAAFELGSQQDQNFLITTTRGERHLLKISNAAFTRGELEAQNVAMARVANAGVATPVALTSWDGSAVVTLEITGTLHYARLMTFVDGLPLIECEDRRALFFESWGQYTGIVSRALANVTHPGLDRVFQWDLRSGDRVVRELARFVRDEHKRELLERSVEKVSVLLDPLRSRLPLQAVHGDLTDDNVICVRDRAGHFALGGVIDFGDASIGWRVGELAVACAAALAYRPESPLVVLSIVESFNAEVPLLTEEIEALWPLIALRAGVLVVSGEQQVAIDPENHYARSTLEREWSNFEVAAAFDWSVASEAVRLRLNRAPSSHVCPGFTNSMLSLPPFFATRIVDLSFASRALIDGSWLETPLVEESRLLHVAAVDGLVAATRFGEARLTRSRILDEEEPVNVALAVDILLRDDSSDLVAPFNGDASTTGETYVLVGETHTLFLTGMVEPRLGAAAVGETIGRTSGVLTVWLARNDKTLDVARVPPQFVRASELLAWRRRLEDPMGVAGLRVEHRRVRSAPLGLARREASYHPLQEHYYVDPPQIERGWREHLIDVHGRHYLDMVNNVAVLGHGHPRIAEAAADQWRMLNTNSRFHFDAVTQLSELVLSTLPPSFDSVMLVNSGTEAVELALRLTRAFSAKEDVLCVTESYHGWSLAADAVSTSESDNPRANQTRPAWAHATATPNAYRGLHRGPDSGAAYASDTISELRRLAATGRPIGTFIIEPRSGNAGAIEVPPGYLSAVFHEVRAGGGVCISDEVQVGYGRQGDAFWGYQQHPGVVPDVITIAKAMGNGHPLGAVITRREIADSLASQGTFFSSAGGSTLSCRIGIEVLEIMKREGLQANALAVGSYLQRRLEELALQHPLIGAVHGRGLYLGVELVRDRTSLEPAVSETALLCDGLRRLGVIVQPTGDRQNILKVKPPLCFTLESADYFVQALGDALTRTERHS